MASKCATGDDAARACLGSSCCIHTEATVPVCSDGRAKEDVKRSVSIRLSSLVRYHQSLLQQRAEVGFPTNLMAAVGHSRILNGRQSDGCMW